MVEGIQQIVEARQEATKNYELTRQLFKCMISEMPKDAIARILFDLWAHGYDTDMKAHLDAGKQAIDTTRPKILEKVREIFSLEEKTDDATLRMLDLAVGTGIITNHLASVIMRQYREKDADGNNTSAIQMHLDLRDISPNMIEVAKSNLEAKKARSNVDWTYEYRVSNIFDPEDRDAERNQFGTMDIVMLSQVLDVMKGCNAKRNALKALYSYLRVGGIGIIIGEDPSMFSVNNSMDPIMEDLFTALFQEKGWDFQATKREITNLFEGRMKMVLSYMQEIDNHHQLFILIVQKMDMPSTGGTTDFNVSFTNKADGREDGAG